MSDEDPIEAWARLDGGTTREPWEADGRGVAKGGAWLVRARGLVAAGLGGNDARLIATDRTLRPELVALVRAAGPAAECTRRPTATDWERCGRCPACRLAVRLDAFRAKLRATMGER